MNIIDFLQRLRDCLVVGEDKIISVFLFQFPKGDTIRIRFDMNLHNLKGWNHISYDIERPAKYISMLNEDNLKAFFEEIKEEVNGRISEWEIGEK